MNQRIFLAQLFLIIHAFSLVAVDANQEPPQERPKDNFNLNIYSAVAGRNGKGMILVPSIEERNKVLDNRLSILGNLKQYGSGDNGMNLRLPNRIPRSQQDAPCRGGHFLVACVQVPEVISEIMLKEVLTRYCSSFAVVFFRHPYEFIWLEWYDRVSALIKDPSNFESQEPEGELAEAIRFFERNGFAISSLKKSPFTADDFSQAWGAFAQENRLPSRKTNWIQEQEFHFCDVCNQIGISNPKLSEPKLLSTALVVVTVECDSLLQAISSHQRLHKLGLQQEKQQIFSEVSAQFEPSKVVVCDDTCRRYVFFLDKLFRFLAAPVSEEQLKLVYDIVSAQRNLKLECQIGHTVQVHEVVILGSPTIKDLVDALKLYFPNDQAFFVNNDIKNDSPLTEFVESGLEVEMKSGINMD